MSFHHSSNAGASRFVVTLTACIVVLVLLGVLTVRHVVVEIPAEVARRTTEHFQRAAGDVAEDIARIFEVRPTVIVDGETVIRQSDEVTKVATFEKRVTVRHRMEHSWLHSTKTFEVRGNFVVSAGFDLGDSFIVEIDRTTGEVRVSLPEARILSVDMRNISIGHDEDGLWNKLTAEDREAAIGALRWRASLSAEREGILEAARESAKTRLVAALDGRRVVFVPEKAGERQGAAGALESADPRETADR